MPLKRDIGENTISPLSFCYWLRGHLEIGKPTNLNQDQITEIQNHLDLVLTKVTPRLSPIERNKQEENTTNSDEGPDQPSRLLCDVKDLDYKPHDFNLRLTEKNFLPNSLTEIDKKRLPYAPPGLGIRETLEWLRHDVSSPKNINSERSNHHNIETIKEDRIMMLEYLPPLQDKEGHWVYYDSTNNKYIECDSPLIVCNMGEGSC